MTIEAYNAPIEIKKTTIGACVNKFPGLFGRTKLNQDVVFSFAETFFYHVMENMVEGYKSGSFDYFTIPECDVEIEPTGFIPLITTLKEVTVESPMGEVATMSYQAASMVVWIFVLEALARNINDDEARTRIYNTRQDIIYSYTRFTVNGNKLFNQRDLDGIYQLTK